MYYLLVALLIAFGIYTLVGNFITFPTKRTEKAMSTFKRKQGIGEKFYTTVTYPLTKIISKFIRMENYQKESWKRIYKEPESVLPLPNTTQKRM